MEPGEALQEEQFPILTVFDCLPSVDGGISKKPITTIEEHHGNNFVKIYIHEKKGRFVYAYQLRINRLVRQKVIQETDDDLGSAGEAQAAAWKEILKLCTENKAKKFLLAHFNMAYLDQMELFYD